MNPASCCIARGPHSSSPSRSPFTPRLVALLRFVLGLFAGALFVLPAAAQGTLEVSKSIQGGLTTVASGIEFTYIINYRYASQTQNGQNVKIEDNLDPDLSWTASEVVMGSSSHIANMTYTAATGKAVWTFVNPLPAGSSGQLTLKVRFKTGTTPNGTVATNAVHMSADNATAVDSSVVSISATAAYLQSALKTWSAGGTPGYQTTYKIEVRNPIGGTNGALALTNATIIDPLPAGTEYVSATGGGTYDSVNHRVVWSNATAAVGNANAGFSQTVTLRYPSALFGVGTNVCNDMTVTGTAVGGVPVSLSDQECHNLIAANPSVTGFTKSSTDTTPEIGQNFDYRITFANTGTVPVENYVIEDPVPAKVIVTLARAVLVTSNATTRLRYERSDSPGTWVDFPGSPYSLSTNVTAPTLPGGVWMTKLRWDLGLLPQNYSSPSGASAVRYAATLLSTDRNGNTVQVGNTFTNCAVQTYSYTATNYAGTNCVTSTVVGLFANPEALKTMSGTYVPGGEVPITLSVRNRSGCTDGLTNPVVADLLPVQLEYVSGSSSASGVASPVSLEPQILPNYRTTGRTLLRWTYNTNLAAGTAAPSGNKDANISFRARVKSGTPPANYNNTNRAYVVSWSNTGSVTLQGSTQDVFDLDGDGSTTDQICQSSTTSFTVGTSASLDSYKYVKGQLDADWSRYPSSGRTSPGGTADYRLVVQNSGNVSLTNIAIVDILAAVGDTGVVDLSARNSQWTPFLAGPVSAPSGVTVYYSTEKNPQRDDMGDPDPFPAGSQTPGWTAIPPTDITTVRSIRFDFGTKVLAPLDQFELRWPMRAPVDAPTGGEIAWNSFGVVARRVDNSLLLLPTEPIKVGIAVEPIQPAAYGSFVWSDTDHDGIQDSGEPGLDGVRVELYRDNGDGIANPAVDEYVGFTLTSGGGQYVFSFLPAGSYFAVFYRPATYSTSPANAGSSDDEDSDGSASTLNGWAVTMTPVTSLVLGEIDLTWDQGFYQPTIPVAAVGNYVWFDENGDGLQNEPAANGLNGVTVRLLTGTGTLQATTTTVDDPNGNPGFYLFDGVTPGSYKLEFVLPNGFTFTTRGPTGSSDASDSDPDATTGQTETFTLTGGAYDSSWDAGMRLPTGNLSLGDRVWLDTNGNGIYEPGLGEPGIDGVVVNLYFDTDNDGVLTPGTDQFFATTTTFTRSGVPGYYSFANLPAGPFIVQINTANFANGAPLFGASSTAGNGIAPDPDNNVDNDDQGEPMTGQGVVAKAITLASGTEPGSGGNDNPTVDFGFTRPAALGNLVWLDADNDGSFDPGEGESGINGVTVELYYDANHDGDFADAGETTPYASTVTATLGGTNGVYGFTNLPPGSFYVRIPTPPTSAPMSSTTTSTADNQIDNDDNGTQTDGGLATVSPTIALSVDETDATVDFGFFPGFDFGDLPDAASGTARGDYETRYSRGGPYHRMYPGGGFRLGSSIDVEGGGLQNSAANADDASDTGAADDEDGVTLPTGSMLAGSSYLLAFQLGANVPGFTPYLNVWVDFNGDGDFDDTIDGESEHIRSNTVMRSGNPTQAMLSIPASAAVGIPVGLRVRLSDAPLSSPNGDGGYGEVEDYLLTFAPLGGPTLALVTELRARQFAGRTLVDWQTAHESGSVAFQLLRQSPDSGAWETVGTDLLAASRNPAGSSYRVVDPLARAGQTVSYAVREFDDEGNQRQYGPFEVEVTDAAGDLDLRLPVESRVQSGTGSGSTPGAGSTAIAVSVRPGALVAGGVSSPKPTSGATTGSTEGSSVTPSLAAFVKIPTTVEGVHFVPVSELAKATAQPEAFWRGLLTRQAVALTCEAEPVPILVAEGQAGIFFHAAAPQSLFTTRRVFWLSGGTALAPRTIDGTPGDGESVNVHRARVAAEENLLAVTTLTPDPAQDYWMWRRLATGTGAESEARFAATLDDLVATALDGEARWTVTLFGGDTGTRTVTATLENAAGSTEVGRVTWSGKAQADLSAMFPAHLLVTGENQLRLRMEIADAGVAGLSYVDRYELTYPASSAAVRGLARINAEAVEVQEVTGFDTESVSVLDITDPARPGWVGGVSATPDAPGVGWTARFRTEAGHRYVVFEPAGVTAVSGLGTAPRAALSLAHNRSDYVIISPAALADVAREFAAYRKGQGLTPMVVSLNRVADEFGGGVATPEAIRKFLRVAVKNWSLPPRYVLLLGDGTFDYRDVAGAHDNLLPPEMLPTGWGLYASDGLAGDIDGDGRVDISVGRLPVATAEQGGQMLAKIRDYEGRLGAGTRQALIVADQPDAAGAFVEEAEAIRELIAPAFATTTAYRPVLKSGTAVQRKVREALAADLDYLDYTGHGGHDRLGVAGYLKSADVPTLGNVGHRLPIVTAMTCAVGNFAVPGNDPLGEQLVLAPDRGAIAVWAPSGLSIDVHAQVLNREFARGLAGAGAGTRLGDLVRGAMQTFRDTGGPAELLAIYNLLGDPALRIR